MATLLHGSPAVSLLDVLIVGGGPAGLSAALVLGRCRRRVLVCDAGTPRNARSREMHGYLTRDGMRPADFLAAGREELQRYDVHVRPVRVEAIAVERDRTFCSTLADGTHLTSRLLLLATGVHDRVPAIDGAADCYGSSVFHCPYCDGWEWRDRRLAVYGKGRSGVALALALQTWSPDVVLLTDGSRLAAPLRGQLDERRIRAVTQPIDRLAHHDGMLESVRFRTGETLDRDALFFTTGQDQQSAFAAALGCEVNKKGTIRTDRYGQTCVDGVYVIGDASHDVQFVVVAASEGAKAGVAINHRLQAEAGQVVTAAAE